MGNAESLGIETDLSRLFAPRAVALVGATTNPARFGARVFRHLIKFGYAGRIYPVNPRAAEIEGVKCYPSVLDLPEVPDHVGLVVATEQVFDVLNACAERGVPFATVYTAGFAETGTREGRERQQRLVEFARKTGMRIMGPNCNGVINFVDTFALTSTGAIGGARQPPGNVGVVSQSGGLGQINVMWRAQEIGLGISYEASCGNEADLDSLDFVRFMLRSDATDIILLAIEGIKNGAKLAAVAREALEREKPIVVLKFGRSEAGSRAAASHTGAIAGADDIYDAAFRQYGLIRVNDCNELYETAIFLRKRRWPKGRRAAAISASGGNIVHLADVGVGLGITWPEYTAETRAALGKLMPGYGTVLNPTDMTSIATGAPDVFNSALNAIASDPNVDVVTPVYAFVSRKYLESGAQFVRECQKPAAMLWVGGCTDDPALTAKEMIAAGIPLYRDALPCLRSVRAAMQFAERLEARKRKGVPQRPAGLCEQAAREKLNAQSGTLGEREAKLVLAEYGFPVTRERLARSPAEAVAYARELAVSVALKIDSPDILHKSDTGAIKLGLNGDAAVHQGYLDVMAAAARHSPAARSNGVLVQEMVPPGVEMVLGMINDPVFGAVVAVGLGGIHIEVLRDISYRVAPVTPGEAQAMLRELRGYKMLEGVRGMPPRDIASVCDLIARLSWFAHDFRNEIAEIDINPLIVLDRGAGARVVDALIIRPGSDSLMGNSGMRLSQRI